MEDDAPSLTVEITPVEEEIIKEKAKMTGKKLESHHDEGDFTMIGEERKDSLIVKRVTIDFGAEGAISEEDEGSKVAEGIEEGEDGGAVETPSVPKVPSGEFNLRASIRDLREHLSREQGIILEELQHGSSEGVLSENVNKDPITDEELAERKAEEAKKLMRSASKEEVSEGEEETVGGEYGGEEEEEQEGEEQAMEEEKEEEIKEETDKKQRLQDTSTLSRRISGDFGVSKKILEDEADFFLIADRSSSELKFTSWMSITEHEEEAEPEVVVEPEEIVIDRYEYYKRYVDLMEELELVKIRNNILQKTVAAYFKRRKMDYVLRETDLRFNAAKKYWATIDALGALQHTDATQRAIIGGELAEMTEFRDTEKADTNKRFLAMQNRLKNVGTGLIFTKTALEISDKQLERLLKRQKYQMEQMKMMRLQCIKLRNAIAEKEEKIRGLDNIGGGLTIAYYEQLKLENRIHADKIDERDEELAHLRVAVRNTMQELAHFKEKCGSVAEDIASLNSKMDDLDFEQAYLRDHVNDIHQDRDRYRKETLKLHHNSGLLAYPSLIRDMEESLEELNSLKSKVRKIEEDYKLKGQKIRQIRKNMELFTSGTEYTGARKSASLLIDKLPNEDSIQELRTSYRNRRPSLMRPVIKSNSTRTTLTTGVSDEISKEKLITLDKIPSLMVTGRQGSTMKTSTIEASIQCGKEKIEAINNIGSTRPNESR